MPERFRVISKTAGNLSRRVSADGVELVASPESDGLEIVVGGTSYRSSCSPPSAVSIEKTDRSGSRPTNKAGGQSR